MVPVRVTIMPPFRPTEYLFEKHAHFGEEKWEIFAEAVRQVMLENSHFKPCDQRLREKIVY